ncbi:dipeptide epimerase [Halomicrobium salinisoli]|uniref:dipeptide epimerase n=1 Tax=Halomicrobium salinisoli TaxID=2878391 RepID=UPI001CF05519|nr:dipeptide epimerase [Halomicrobium salinisoli]
MNLAVERHSLAAADPFGIARGTTDAADAVVVELTHEGTTGVGGVAPTAYYGGSGDAVAATLEELRPVIVDCNDPHADQRLSRELAERAPDDPVARSAVSTALADLAARDLGVPCYRQWGLDPDAAPRTSFTVGIDDPDRMAEKAAAAVDEGYPILKIKVGTDDDRARVRAVREAAPDATLRVDANGAWDAAEAVEHARWLADEGVQFLEQPVPKDDLDGLRRVHGDTPLPICADESFVAAADAPRIADACDLVTVKLLKTGGVREAREAIAAAHACGLEVMLGCMLESNASIAPACHLAPLVEYADLDGALLLAEDPYRGVPMPEGRIDLQSVERGSGASKTG